MNKVITIKIYNPSGVIQGIFREFNASTFDTQLYSSPGVVNIELGLRFNDAFTNDAIAKGNTVELYVSDKDTNSQKIYSGIINIVDAKLASFENIGIQVVGSAQQLSRDILETTGNTIKYSYTGTPGNIIKDIIDDYRTNQTSPLVNYSSTSIDVTGDTETVEIELDNPLDAIDAVSRLSGSDYVWYIDEDNIVFHKQISSTPNHYFIVGKDVVSIDYEDNDTKKITKYFLTNGLNGDDPESINKVFTAAGSTERYFELKKDERFRASTGTGDAYANSMLDQRSDGIKTISAIILDNNLTNGYDIESINVGDTCKFLNLEKENTLPTNGLITTKKYINNYNACEIVIADANSYIARQNLERKKQYESNAFGDNLPESYTT